MKTERIIQGDLTLVIVIRDSEWEKGLSFVTDAGDYQQVATWGYDEGNILAPHIHLRAPREVLHTQEVVHVRKGRLKADIYGTDGGFMESVELEEGDTAVLLHGGHGYQVLEDDTRVLEIKNGPYPGPEADRKRI